MKDEINNIINDLEFKLDLNPNEMVSLANVIMMLRLINNEQYTNAISCI